MLHPLYSTLIQRPDLLVEHAAAYAVLFHQEATDAGAILVKRYVSWAIAAVCAMLFLALAGVALMLGALHNQFHWIMIAVPASVFLAMIIFIIKANSPMPNVPFSELKTQIEGDIQALRSVS